MDIIEQKKLGNPGGDIIFTPGKGEPEGEGIDVEGRGGRFIFKLSDGTEAMSFEPDGRVLVRGAVVDINSQIYAAFREWLSKASMHQQPEKTLIG